MNRVIIGVSGKLGTGKDTFSNYMVDDIKRKNNDDLKYNITNKLSFGKLIDYSGQIFYKKIAFADPIKQMAKIAFPMLVDDDLWGPSKNRLKVLPDYKNPKTGEMLSVRDILQFIGQWGRETNPDCWVNAGLGMTDEYIRKNKEVTKGKKICFIFTDVRFKNEKNAIEKMGGHVIRILNSNTEHTSTDISEIDLDDVPLTSFSAVVNNDKDLKHLECEAQRVIRKFLHK